jgi:hypothetical protein
VRDDLGLYVVTGHLGLFQRSHHRKPFEPRRSLGSNRGSGCAAHSLARWINYLAGIIKQAWTAMHIFCHHDQKTSPSPTPSRTYLAPVEVPNDRFKRPAISAGVIQRFLQMARDPAIFPRGTMLARGFRLKSSPRRCTRSPCTATHPLCRHE